MNYLTYPFRTMRITQTYTGTASHLPHTTGSPKDYPIDEAGKDGGKDAVYCPCDSVKVYRIYGVGSGGTNTVFLESTTKVDFADGTRDFFCALLTHPNDDDLRMLSCGKIFKRGEIICHEGSDGASGNHIHLSAGKGRATGSGWKINTKRKWVLTAMNGAYPPEQLFFLDPAFTTVKDSRGLRFRLLPTANGGTKIYAPGNFRVSSADILNVREGPGQSFSKRVFADLTPSAQTKIMRLAGHPADGYYRNLAFTVYEVTNNWGRTPSGWVCLDYCERI